MGARYCLFGGRFRLRLRGHALEDTPRAGRLLTRGAVKLLMYVPMHPCETKGGINRRS